LSEYRYTRVFFLEMTITAENSAQDFYMTLARKFPKHEALFEHLAADEKNQAKVYTDLLKTPEVYSKEDERMQTDFNIRALENEKEYLATLGAELKELKKSQP